MNKYNVTITAPKGASEKTRAFAALLQKGKPFEAFFYDNSQACFQSCIINLVNELVEKNALDQLPAFYNLLGLANHSAAKQSMSAIEIVDDKGKLQSLSAHWAKASPIAGSSKLDLSLFD